MQLNFILLSVVLTSLLQFNTAQNETTTEVEETASTTNVDEAETTTQLEETTEGTDSTQTVPSLENESDPTTRADSDSQTENAQNKSSEATSTTTKPKPPAEKQTLRLTLKQFSHKFYEYVKTSGPAIGSLCFVLGAMYAILAYT